MVALGQLYSAVNPALDVAHHAAEVSAAGVGRDNNLAPDVLAVDGVWTCRGNNVSHVGKGNLPAVGTVDHHVADALHGVAVGLRHTHNKIEALAALVLYTKR